MFFNILFFIFVFIILLGEFGYPRIIRHLPKKSVAKIETLPEITVLIPALNEEKNIADKIQNTLSSDYPPDRIEVIVIENGSSDKTFEIASRFPIKVLQSEKGKINALNKGIRHAKTDFIVITDADIRLNRESLKNLVPSLSEGVGAVSGYVIAQSDGTKLMREKEKYKDKDWQLRFQESQVDSICNLDGKFVVFKKSIFSGFTNKAIVDDYFMTFKIRGKGYRLLVEKSAKAYEKLSGGTKEEFKQFKRYALSALVINFRNIKFLFNPYYGYFGLLTFPFRRFFPVLYPILLFYIAIYLIVYFPPVILFFVAAFIFLYFYRRLTVIQLFAVFLSYVDLFMGLFKRNDLRFGEWKTMRK